MQEDELKNLIAHCKDRGGLNLSDIARWLETHIPTVKEWANGREPRRFRRADVLAKMKKLKEVVDSKPKGETIPTNVKMYNRSRYITELKHATFRISRASAAK